jgi:hypothetical protein
MVGKALVDPIMPVLDGHFLANRKSRRKLGFTLNLVDVIEWDLPLHAGSFSIKLADLLS